MAAHGQSSALQIFVAVRRGTEPFPRVVDVRVRYEETVADVKRLAAAKLGLPDDKLQLFHHKKELTTAYDSRTLSEMSMHTGFALQGWDLTEAPNYWPPVTQGPDGLVINC